jgi:hypothetical protein
MEYSTQQQVGGSDAKFQGNEFKIGPGSRGTKEVHGSFIETAMSATG